MFAACKTVPAVEVARLEGIPLHRAGSRHRALCPLHGEKTPSLYFFEGGGWKCFGCGRGGDAVSFYADLHHVTQIEAAKQLVAAFGLNADTRQPYKQSEALRLKQMVETAYRERHSTMCATLHAAKQLANDNPCWDNPLFVEALKLYASTFIALEQWALETPEEKLQEAHRWAATKH